MNGTCKAKTRSGEHCKARVSQNGFCAIHADPSRASELGRRSGKARRYGDAGRVRWVSGTPGKPPAYAGTDFIVARNGRIALVYLFFDNLP